MKIIVIGEPQEGCHTFGEMLRVDSSSARLASSTDPDLNTEEDVIVLPYSSGTTGPPKGCMITHYNMVNNLIQSAERISVTPFTNGNPQEVGMGLLPFFHIMAFQALGLYAYRIGGKVLTLPRFEPETFTDCMKNNKVLLLTGNEEQTSRNRHHYPDNHPYIHNWKISCNFPLLLLVNHNTPGRPIVSIHRE